MAEKDSVIFRMEFKDPTCVPDSAGMDSMLRLLNNVFIKGGVLVFPEVITTEWLVGKLKDEAAAREKDGKHVDFYILGAIKAVEISRVRLEFPEEKK
jgi:hypothetical protein